MTRFLKKELYALYHLLPDSLTKHIDCRRRRKCWRSRGSIFVHVPKAAGTSVSHALYGRSLGHFKAREIKKYCPTEFLELFKFSFVRNPWDRVVSAYRFAAKGTTDTAGMRHRKLYSIPEFQSFDTFIYEWLADKDLTKLDNVFQPQWQFVADEYGELMVDFLGKVETFESDMKRVSDIIGKPINVMELNRTSEKGSYINYYHDAVLINKVGDLFERDVALFGYDFK